MYFKQQSMFNGIDNRESFSSPNDFLSDEFSPRKISKFQVEDHDQVNTIENYDTDTNQVISNLKNVIDNNKKSDPKLIDLNHDKSMSSASSHQIVNNYLNSSNGEITEIAYVLNPPENYEFVVSLSNMDESARVESWIFKDLKYLMEHKDSIQSLNSM